MKTRPVEDFICANLEPLRVYSLFPFKRKSAVVVRTTHEMGAAFAEWQTDLSTVRWQHEQPQVSLRFNAAGFVKGLREVAKLTRKWRKKMKAIPDSQELWRIERATMGNDPHYDGPYNRKLRWRVLALLSAWHRQHGTYASMVRWWTVQDLAESACGTETSVSSAIRDLRKVRCGSHVVVRRRGKGGLSQYALFPKGQADELAAKGLYEPT